MENTSVMPWETDVITSMPQTFTSHIAGFSSCGSVFHRHELYCKKIKIFAE